MCKGIVDKGMGLKEPIDRVEDMTGYLFNNQQVLAFDSTCKAGRHHESSVWLCQCFKCGTKSLKRIDNIKTGQGCMKCRKWKRKHAKSGM